MKKLGLLAILALGGLLLCSTAAIAQDTNNAGAGKDGKQGKRGFPTIEERMDRLTKELNLTADQKPKVKTALEEQRKELQGVRDLSQDERREKFRSSQQELDKKLKAILTPEQYQKYESMPRGPGGKKGGKKKSDSQ